MAKKIKCYICGAEFETIRPNKKYCSFTCKEAGRKLQRMKWDAAHPNYNATYMQNYRTLQKNEKATEKTTQEKGKFHPGKIKV